MKRGAPRHGWQAHGLAAFMLAAMACGFTGTPANAQSDDLVTAAARGDLAAVNAFLTAGADVNDAKNMVLGTRSNSFTQATALMAASSNGHLEIVQALLAARADVNAGSIPALYYAVAAGNFDIVKALLAAKPNLDWRDPLMGTTTLMLALAPIGNVVLNQLPPSGRWDIAQLLMDAGANVNAMTKAGVTALMLVVQEDSPRSLAMVQALLAAHADINGGCTCGSRSTLGPVDYARADGYTALGLAASTGSVEVVKALLDANAQRAAKPAVAVNAKQPGGNTPLTIASAKGRSDVVRLLLAAGADVSAADDNGKTALMLASENNHPEVAELLRSATAALPGRN